jgi:uncharacterized membrane protein YvbJ
MFSFCPHCGQTTDQDQVAGQMLVCTSCGKPIGVVQESQGAPINETEQRIRAGTAARCPICRQAVEVKTAGVRNTFVPHYRAAGQRKICPGSGKSV